MINATELFQQQDPTAAELSRTRRALHLMTEAYDLIRADRDNLAAQVDFLKLEIEKLSLDLKIKEG